MIIMSKKLKKKHQKEIARSSLPPRWLLPIWYIAILTDILQTIDIEPQTSSESRMIYGIPSECFIIASRYPELGVRLQ